MAKKRKGAKRGSSASRSRVPKAKPKKIIAVAKQVLRVAASDIPRSIAEAKSVYVVKHAPAPVPRPSSISEADKIMPLHIEWGVLTGRNLANLEQVISAIYLPLLVSENVTLTDSNQAASEDFLVNLRKFASHMRRTIQQVEGDVKLKLTDINADKLQDVKACASDPELLAHLDKTMEGWIHTIKTVTEDQLKKTPAGNGPLAEIDYWIERSSTFTALYEQLEIPAVVAVISVQSQVNSMAMAAFDNHKRELTRYYIEAKDNVKFLSTLERHFKNLSACSDLNVAAEIVPSILGALRMVWIISRHYNTDQRMVPLMERIAWLIADKVTRRIDVKKLLRLDMLY